MSQALYYENPYQTEFEARIVRTEPAKKGAIWAELDRTCFYPEGGGQPADRGWINDIPVRDVKKQDGRILHLLPEDPRGRDGATGDAEAVTVQGRVDWDMRHDYMQQHTGQHLISGAMMAVGGYETVSVHQGEEYTTVEFSAADIPREDLERAEARVNDVVGENRAVRTFYADSRETDSLGLRRPPKLSGRIRIVEIQDFDRVACGGVHCGRTGEVGIVKLTGTERIRGNVRTIWKIGDRALADYRLKTRVVNSLVDTFSAKPHELPERAAKLEEHLKQAQYEVGRLQKRLAAEVAAGLLGTKEPEAGRIRIITRHFEDEAKELFRAVSEQLAEEPAVAALLTNEAGGRLQWIVVATEGVDLDFARVRSELLPLVEGKGGGKPPIWQGIGNDPSGAGAFATAFRELPAVAGK